MYDTQHSTCNSLLNFFENKVVFNTLKVSKIPSFEKNKECSQDLLFKELEKCKKEEVCNLGSLKNRVNCDIKEQNKSREEFILNILDNPNKNPDLYKKIVQKTLNKIGLGILDVKHVREDIDRLLNNNADRVLETLVDEISVLGVVDVRIFSYWINLSNNSYKNDFFNKYKEDKITFWEWFKKQALK